jgi:type II secretory pathway component PulL
MDPQEQLFGLMTLAEEHRKATQAAMDGLAAERAALAQERAALAKLVQNIPRVAGEAIARAMQHSLAGTSDAAVQALTRAAEPLTQDMRAVTSSAGAAARQAAAAARFLSWRIPMIGAGCVVAVALFSWIAVAWLEHRVDALGAQQTQLAAQIEQEQANVAALDKRGGRVHWTTCGSRLCFEASGNQGTAQDGNPVQLGGWTADGGKIMLVIPRGY